MMPRPRKIRERARKINSRKIAIKMGMKGLRK
uniref:Uncharacterized protein n=1 Tax=Rhizophora mucronata TaxID=61149 RepID=A0A2P2QCT3_RHIMU